MRCAGGMSEFPLVEPEGVNAGSAAESAEEDHHPAPPEATRDGGDPSGAPGPFAAATDPPEPADDELVGTGDPQAESGQDSGSNR